MINASAHRAQRRAASLEDLGSGTTKITVRTPTVGALGDLIDEGLLDYVAALDGSVEMTIEFARDGTTVTTIRPVD